MPKFKTHTERMKHKQAKLIPLSMWQDSLLFNESLNDTVLFLMKSKPGNLETNLIKSLPKLNNEYLKNQAWLVIALTQQIPLPRLLEIATILELNDNTLFYGGNT